MIEPQLLLGTLLSLVNIVFHMTGLIALGWALSVLLPTLRAGSFSPKRILFLSGSVVVLIIMHLTEAAVWAAAYCWLGEFERFSDALYFSVITATTLGYGDLVLSPAWRMLSVFEAMTGLLLFGASTACLFQLMTKSLPNPFDPDESENTS